METLLALQGDAGDPGRETGKGRAQNHQWRPPLRSGNECRLLALRREVVGVVVVRRLPCFVPAWWMRWYKRYTDDAAPRECARHRRDMEVLLGDRV